MALNDEAHFSQVPSIDIERSRIDRSHSHKFSGNVGSLIPIYCEEILPGTTVTMDTSCVLRFQTMQTPIMDDLYCDVSFWFIPDRLCWTHFKEFMGENTASAWIPQVTYTKPTLKVYDPRYSTGIIDNFNRVGTILDYMGFPVGVNLASSSSYVEIDATPFRAYALVCNEFWRDENITDPLVINLGDSSVDATAVTNDTYIQTVAKGGDPFVAAKMHDYFTSCLPGPQKGPSVTLPLGDKAPVMATATDHNYNTKGLRWSTVSGTGNLTNGTNYIVTATADSTSHAWTAARGTSSSASTASITPSNLWADLSNATAATISDIRMAFQLQKFYERMARSGSRYQEIIAGFFSVEAQDYRLQRPEFLGGNRFPINVEQVANSAQTSSDALGDVGAFSRTSNMHSQFTKSFVEHGWLLGCAVCRYMHSYSQGLPKKFTRLDRLSHYFPSFAHISEQPVDKSEIYVGTTGTFGYNEAWAAYRYSPNTVAGEMRPYVSNSLGVWHLGDDYASAPTLSDSWIREDKTNVDRVLTVTSSAANQFWADFYFSTYWTVPMPLYSVPGLVDHF